MSIVKTQFSTKTKLSRIAWISEHNLKKTFSSLMHHINETSLKECFEEVDGKKAKGIDNVSKEEYGLNLDKNIQDLVERMKQMRYIPKPVKRVDIPKGDGKTRPLGISTFEDKLVQMMIHKILEAIYEPLFRDCSYGFRPGKSCHDAIKDINKYLHSNKVAVIIDLDLANFFNTIDHKKLLEILDQKLKDPVFRRYIVRKLKAGVLAKGEFSISDEGVPQGSICSPILANIFLHYVIDEWMEEVVPKYCLGKVKMFRYADDIVICVENEQDIEKIHKALANRLDKYNLKMNEEKTKVIPFSQERRRRGEKQGTFDFLGFTFYFDKSRKGQWIIKVKTKKKAISSKLKNVKIWIKGIRCKENLKSIWQTFRAKLRGHINYYSVSHNTKEVENFLWQSSVIVFKWLNRRSQRKSFTWDQFNLLMKKYPLPKVCIKLKLF
jgi:group II intron reverse transcriptase/maturase